MADAVVTNPFDPDDPTDVVFTPATNTVEYTTTIQNPGSWTLVPFLWCQQLKLAVNAYDTAELIYFIGKAMQQPGDSALHDFVPLDLRGKYVRITVPQEDEEDNIVWVGHVLMDGLKRDGVQDDGGGNKFQGDMQQFSAVGLEWFLDRKQVDSTVLYPSTRILRAMKFNGGESQSIDMKGATRGNRSTELGPDGMYVFTDDDTTENEFQPSEMVKYLLKYDAMKDSAGQPAPCEYVLDPDDDADGYLDGLHPTVSREKRTVFRILNELVNPQRGLVWWLEFDSTAVFAETPKAYLRVRTLATDDIGLSNDGVFIANQEQITLDFDAEVDVKSVDLKDIGHRNYHKVICRGARQTVTMTVGLHDNTLVTDWKEVTELDYEDAANTDTDYAALPLPKKRDRNDAFRVSDLYGRVFAYFRIPATWDGRSGDGWEADLNNAFAELDEDGGIVGELPLKAPAIRLLNKTRLKLGVDYSDPTHPVSNAPDGSLEEFVAPFALLQVEKSPAVPSDAPDPDRWQYCEKMDHARFHAGTPVAPNIHTSYNLLMQPHVPGIILRANGAPAHVMALGHFEGSEPSNFRPEVTYESLRATVCAESDNYAEGVKAITPLPAGVPIEELVVEMGDDFRLDFLAENTIVDLKSGVPVRAGSHAVLRDDRATLRDMATVGFEWYRANRKSLTVEFRQLRKLFTLGQLVTTIGSGSTSEDVNTVVSVITYDFQTSSTTLQTHDETLDVRSLYEPSRAKRLKA